MFVVGDKVRWKSASGGKIGEKIGSVVAVVPCNIIPESGRRGYTYGFMNKVLGEGWKEKYSLCKMGGGGGRKHVSYLIVVKTGKTDRSLPQLYWPRIKWLEKVDSDS